MKRFIKKLPLIRNVLRIKDLFLTQINTILSRVEVIEQYQYALMENQTALLQAAVHNVEHLKRRDVEDRQSIETINRSLMEIGEHLAKARLNVRTSKYGLLNPEPALMEHLFSYLGAPVALDIGSNVGEISERLLNAGYSVHAFEPFPEIFEKLTRRLCKRKNFKADMVAVGSQDNVRTKLYIAQDLSPDNKYKDFTQFSSLVAHSMPGDLRFSSSVEVTVRTLESLVRSGEVPSDIGLLKIDTEGYDLEVIRGMVDQRPEVVTTEFWDKAFMFGKSGVMNSLPELVQEMRARDYSWHIVIYRIDGSYDVSFYCNHPESLEKSWGNVFFFQDHETFVHAREWCEAVLPHTYFCE